MGSYTWNCAKHLFPDPLDSRKRVMNPDYHDPISYENGKFRNMLTGKEIPKKDVPAYILEEVARLPKKPPAPHQHIEYDLKDIMAGKPLLDEALTHKVLERQAKEKEKEDAKAKRKRTRRVGNARVQTRRPKKQLREDSDGRGSSDSDRLERAAESPRPPVAQPEDTPREEVNG